MERGLLEELLSSLAGQEALLCRLSEVDADPCWVRQIARVQGEIADLRKVLNLEDAHVVA